MEILRSEDAQPSELPELPGSPGSSGSPGPPGPEGPRFAIVGPRRVWVSPAIIALNVIVFVVMIASGASFITPSIEDLLKFGADHGPLVADGQWWRLLTNTFVHVGILHIGLNMWVFRSLGTAVERLFGNAAFALVYIASALGASITSMLWNPAGVSAGASGAIFGVAGAFLAFFLGHRQAMPTALFRSMTKSLVQFVAINTVFGFIVPGIDNAAHLGGLATGFVAGAVLNRDVRVTPTLDLRRVVRGTLLIAGLLAIAWLIPWRVRTDAQTGPRQYFTSAERALDEKDFTEVVRVAGEWLVAWPDDARAWEMRGVGRFGLGEDGAAREDLDQALSLDDELPFALSHRAYLRIQEGNVEGALHDYDAYVKLLPADTFGFIMRANVRYAQRDWPGALRDLQTAVGLDPVEASGARLYVWVLRSRLGMREAATDELKRSLAEGLGAQWQADIKPIAVYLSGDLDEAQLAALLPDSVRSAADYFCGMKRLIDGDHKAATEFFERCIESGDAGAFETIHAKAELELLAK
jgi:rhomboid protease GluP